MAQVIKRVLTVVEIYSAMGIRKKTRRQFCFYFWRHKGQIERHYNGKSF